MNTMLGELVVYLLGAVTLVAGLWLWIVGASVIAGML